MFTYNSREGTIENPYLIELVRDMPPLGTKETKRATTGVLNRNIVVK
jgi:hypothetical protein